MSASEIRAALKRAAKLQQKKYREKERLFLAEGHGLISEAREAPRHLFSDAEDVKRLSALNTPTGPVGVFPFLDVGPEELLGNQDRVVLMHGVQDPGNVGTIIRAAHAFDAGVALSTGCADLYNSKTVRGTMGSIFHVSVARELDSQVFINESHNKGFTSAATMPQGGDAPHSMPEGKLIIVVGAEGEGLPEVVSSACERTVTIPSLAASINVAMAASILLYEAYMRVLT